MMPKKQRVLPHPSTLVEVGPNDDFMFRERYKTIKALVYELEDENNLVAFKIAQTRARIETLRLESVRQEREALEERTRDARVKTTTPPFSPRPAQSSSSQRTKSARDPEPMRATTTIPADLPDTLHKSNTPSISQEWPRSLPHPFPFPPALQPDEGDVGNRTRAEKLDDDMNGGVDGRNGVGAYEREEEKGRMGPDGEEDELMDDY